MTSNLFTSPVIGIVGATLKLARDVCAMAILGVAAWDMATGGISQQWFRAVVILFLANIYFVLNDGD